MSYQEIKKPDHVWQTSKKRIGWSNFDKIASTHFAIFSPDHVCEPLQSLEVFPFILYSIPYLQPPRRLLVDSIHQLHRRVERPLLHDRINEAAERLEETVAVALAVVLDEELQSGGAELDEQGATNERQEYMGAKMRAHIGPHVEMLDLVELVLVLFLQVLEQSFHADLRGADRKRD